MPHFSRIDKFTKNWSRPGWLDYFGDNLSGQSTIFWQLEIHKSYISYFNYPTLVISCTLSEAFFVVKVMCLSTSTAFEEQTKQLKRISCKIIKMCFCPTARVNLLARVTLPSCKTLFSVSSVKTCWSLRKSSLPAHFRDSGKTNFYICDL